MKFKGTAYKGFITVELWDNNLPFDICIVRSTDSVMGLLYDKVNDRVLLVNQQRAAMISKTNQNGFITELVAGRFDVDLDPKELLIKEAQEEVGVELLPEDVEFVNEGVPMALSAGISTEKSYALFATIHPEKVEPEEIARGIAEEGESITRVWQDAEEFINAKHDCLKVWAFAQFLARRRLEKK